MFNIASMNVFIKSDFYLNPRLHYEVKWIKSKTFFFFVLFSINFSFKLFKFHVIHTVMLKSICGFPFLRLQYYMM